MKKIIVTIFLILYVCVNIILLPISLLMLGLRSLIPDSKAEEMGFMFGKFVSKLKK